MAPGAAAEVALALAPVFVTESTAVAVAQIMQRLRSESGGREGSADEGRYSDDFEEEANGL
jgi:hypothetical protein